MQQSLAAPIARLVTRQRSDHLHDGVPPGLACLDRTLQGWQFAAASSRGQRAGDRSKLVARRRKIIFATQERRSSPRESYGESYVSVLDLASHQITMLPGSAGMDSPHWSPDGQYIKTERTDRTQRGLGRVPNSTLCIFDTKTQHWSTLYKGFFTYSSFSSDSRSIYFLRFAGDPAILCIPVTGGEAKVVVGLKDFLLPEHSAYGLGWTRPTRL